MKFPNKYLRNLRPYKLASHKIWSVTPEERRSILKLDWNEATIPPSPKVREYLRALMDEPDFFNLYPATLNESLLNALSGFTELPKENIQYFGSSDALHEYICKVFIGVGDPVMILGPSYDNFRLTCQANGGEVFYSNYNEDFTFDSSRFERDIVRVEPAVVYICNPNNPTGNIHTKSYIEHLLNTFPDTLFLIDEAYMEFGGLSAKELVLNYDNILISRTMSKAFALANFRVGYLMASKDNIQFINKIRNPKNLSTIAQTAAIAALEDCHYMWNYVDAVHKGKQFFVSEMERLVPSVKLYPGHGNFCMMELSTVEEKRQLIAFLSTNNIFVRELTQGPIVERCFRITIGTVDQMRRVIETICRFYTND
jgi:histidinol-phosphate aminotransferase